MNNEDLNVNVLLNKRSHLEILSNYPTCGIFFKNQDNLVYHLKFFHEGEMKLDYLID